MKTRNGFVSNSSSSSFIIAIGKVIDKEKVESFLDSCGMKDSYFISIEKLSGMTTLAYPTNINDERIAIECFEGSSVELDRSLLKEDDEVLVIYIANNEGDCGIFSGYVNGEYVEIDYNIDLDDLPGKQAELYDGLCESNGIIHVDKKYGAARNG